jgi:hypothetical protein
MKIRFEKRKSIQKRSNKRIEDYICINGKLLSEQTIYDYAPFIPKWDERIEIEEDSFLVSCVFSENHNNGDDPSRGGKPSLLISKGHTQPVVTLCRAGCCDNNKILQYFLSRLTGEVPMREAIAYSKVLDSSLSKKLSKEEFMADNSIIHTDKHPMGMSKERQWELHQQLREIHKKSEKQKSWKQMSQQEKDDHVKLNREKK